MDSHVCVMTPSYDASVSLQFLDSLISNMHNSVVSYRYWAGDSLVTRARNNLFTKFVNSYKAEGWTHLLWQDGDVGIAHDGIARMLARKVDVIAAPVPLKTRVTRHGWAQSVLGPVTEIEPMFYEAKFAATGCLMLSVNAVLALRDYCESGGHTYTDVEGRVWEVFRNGSRGDFYESEDWYLCRIVRELGFSIYVDSSFLVLHADGPRNVWARPPMPIAETLLVGDYDRELPVDLRDKRWATNDFDRQVAEL